MMAAFSFEVWSLVPQRFSGFRAACATREAAERWIASQRYPHHFEVREVGA